MASKTVNGRKVLVGSVADPASAKYDPTKSRNVQSPGTITLNTISGAPPRPANIPATQPTTATPALEGAITASQDAFTRDLERKTATAEAGRTDSFESLLESLTSTTGKSTLTNDLYSREGGVDDLDSELQDINDQILQEQEALRKQIQSVQTAAGTSTSAERDRRVGEIQRTSLRKQADLAIIQLSRQGKYDSAKAIADRAVEAQLESQKQRNEILSLVYQENKDLFTTAEAREFETKQADRQSKLEMERQKEMARFEQVIRQSDPLYKANLANVYSQINARNAAASNPTGTINGKPQTATQAQVQGYADRTNQADVIISTIGSKFTGAASLVGERLPNILKSTERQQYEQAQRNFVNAVLRRESGAVISEEEFNNARAQYFPQPGDQPEVVAQKAANRMTVIDNLYQQSNVPRTALPGQIVEDADGKRYQVDMDGENLIEI